jgi:thymidylate synthase
LSKADNIFINNCNEILNYGSSDENQIVRPKWEDGTPAHTIKVFGMINRYDLSKEFPILTLRKTNLKNCIDEILWIWQKKSNNIKDLNSHIWDAWADENGSIGKAYGYQLSVKHKYPEGMFDQVDRILFDLKTNPYSRRIIANLYNPQDLHEMHLYPCVYSLLLNVVDGKLNAVLTQRSQDMLVANNWNVCQYAILVYMLAQVSGLAVGELIHVVADSHIYDRHVETVKEVINHESFPAPRLIIDENIKDFYQFTVDSFELENYQYCNKKYKIPVAV